jgi:hypothetical protein
MGQLAPELFAQPRLLLGRAAAWRGRAGIDGAAQALLGLLGLVKVVARPAEDSLFWAQACVLFTAATVEGFIAVAEVEAVRECALAAAARRHQLAPPDAPAAAAPAAYARAQRL